MKDLSSLRLVIRDYSIFSYCDVWTERWFLNIHNLGVSGVKVIDYTEDVSALIPS